MNTQRITLPFVALLSTLFAPFIMGAPQDTVYNVGNTRIVITAGDITAQRVDAIVNAANQNLQHGGGVAAAISKAAGPQMQQRCNAQNLHCRVGHAVATDAFNLKKNDVRHIIHAVGPDCRIPEQNNQKEKFLEGAYQNSLACAANLKARTIAFPAISTAIFGYDVNQATPIAIQAIVDFIKKNPQAFDEIRLVIWKDNTKDFKVYTQNAEQHIGNAQQTKNKNKKEANFFAHLFCPEVLIPALIITAGSYLIWKYRKTIKKKYAELKKNFSTQQ